MFNSLNKSTHKSDKINTSMDEVIINIIHTSLVKDNFSFLVDFVDQKRKEKALKFLHEKDQLLSLGAGFLLRACLPVGEIKMNETGKPYLEEGPFFNISHSGEYSVLAIHQDREVGVDIEEIDIKQNDAIRYVLNYSEQEITDSQTLFQMWSTKEAIVKCTSRGIRDIKSVDGMPFEGVRNINGKEYYVKSMIYENYSLSVALLGNKPFNIKINRINSLEEK